MKAVFTRTLAVVAWMLVAVLAVSAAMLGLFLGLYAWIDSRPCDDPQCANDWFAMLVVVATWGSFGVFVLPAGGAALLYLVVRRLWRWRHTSPSTQPTVR